METLTEIQQKWDQRYADLTLSARGEPTPFFLRCLPRLPILGHALDVAAGAGRHTVLLAAHGLQVDAVDVSWQGLRLAHQRAEMTGVAEQVCCIVADLEQPWLPHRQYDVIVTSFFLHRPLIPVLKDRLRPGGWLIYETFVFSPAEDESKAPCRFWLQPGELCELFSDFNVLFCDEGYSPDSHPNRVTARLLAQKVT